MAVNIFHDLEIAVVRRPISPKLRLNFNPGIFLFYSKAFSSIIFSILLRSSNHHVADKSTKLNLLFKLSNRN